MLRTNNTTFSAFARSVLARDPGDDATRPAAAPRSGSGGVSDAGSAASSCSLNTDAVKASGPARNGPGGGPSGAALGSNRELFHPRVSKPQINRREMRADQRAASAIYFKNYREMLEAGADRATLDALPAQGVGGCGLSQIAEMETLLQRREISEGQFYAFVSGARVCGLRWVCVACARKAAEDDRKTVNAGLAAARAKGLIPVMMTLTTRHSRKDQADALLAAIARAEQRLKRLKCWAALPVAGYARVLEWTYGENGHHPHFHMILLMRAESEADAVAMVQRLHPSYMGQLAKAGRDGVSEAAWKHSFQVQGAAAASKYLTKWNAAEELTGAQHKAGNGGFTQWQLLRLARKAAPEKGRTAEQARAFYAARWWEVMCAVKGRAQLYKSDGFKDLAAEFMAENPDAEPPEPQTLLSFGTREKHGPQTEIWGLAAPALLAIREAAERIPDLETASTVIREGLYRGLFRTDADLLADESEDDGAELVEPDEIGQVADDAGDGFEEVGHSENSVMGCYHGVNTGVDSTVGGP
uniref:Replication protein n=1 Tax=uncultured prokaryote TaxID=198431 RepID=A0A0H5Q0W3_9ZZZZ|nr:hypothetical protein [uncultured prokaryote]